MHSFGDNRLFLSKIHRFYMIYKMLAKKSCYLDISTFPELSNICRHVSLVACPLSPACRLSVVAKYCSRWKSKIMDEKIKTKTEIF